jgi:hypothetical protein
VRIIDIGGSYKKIANMLGARYLDFQPGTTVCLNPFTSIREPEEELKVVTAVFAQMAYSNTDTSRCDDTEMNLIRNAVRWAWQQRGQEADADTVYEFLMPAFRTPPRPTWMKWATTRPGRGGPKAGLQYPRVHQPRLPRQVFRRPVHL